MSAASVRAKLSDLLGNKVKENHKAQGAAGDPFPHDGTERDQQVRERFPLPKQPQENVTPE